MPEVRMPLHIQEAERLGHNGIGCEHLLLGILANESSPAAKVLAAHGLTLDVARRRTAEIVGDGWQDSVRWSYSPRATVVSTLAEVEAERLGEVHPRQAHLVLALITEGGGIPIDLLRETRIDLDELREALLDTLDPDPQLRELYVRQRTASMRAVRQPGAPYADEV